eukprot:3123469-Pyramimonas_sp.AAC.1
MLPQLAVGGTLGGRLLAFWGPLGASSGFSRQSEGDVLQYEAVIGSLGCVEARLEGAWGHAEAIQKPPRGLLQTVLMHRGHCWAILGPL